jgi:hypothetical protein
VQVVAYTLFFLAGLGFGYAAPGRAKLLPLAFPVVLALGAILKNGIDGAVLIRLIVALAITGLGILLGKMLDDRAQRREAAEAA